jgi:hypothetical protein
MKTLLPLLACCMLAWGEDPKPDRKLIPLHYVDAGRVRSLAGTFAGRDLLIDADDRLHWIAVRGPAEMVAAFEEAVKKLDTPPLGFELTVYLISASPQPGDHLPEALASTAKQLHTVFAYKGYDLLESFVLRGKDGQRDANADGAIKTSTYQFRYRHASVLDGAAKTVSLENLSLQLRSPTGRVDSKGNPDLKYTGLTTDVDIRDGQKVVVGKSDVNSEDSPLILVVTAKVVE